MVRWIPKAEAGYIQCSRNGWALNNPYHFLSLKRVCVISGIVLYYLWCNHRYRTFYGDLLLSYRHLYIGDIETRQLKLKGRKSNIAMANSDKKDL